MSEIVCVNCGQPQGEHKTVKEYLWGGDFTSDLVCPTSFFRSSSGPWDEPPSLDELAAAGREED